MEEAPLSFRESEMILNSQLDKKVDKKIGIILHHQESKIRGYQWARGIQKRTPLQSPNITVYLSTQKRDDLKLMLISP